MDRVAIEEVHRQNPVYREPPRKWHNTLRAGLIMLTVAVLAGLIFFACYLVYQRNFISPQQRGYVLKSEHSIPYPHTRRAAANRYGGSRSGWHRYGDAGWVYDGDTPLEITHGQNVTMFTTHAAFYWE
jgi:hypothetical protein